MEVDNRSSLVAVLSQGLQESVGVSGFYSMLDGGQSPMRGFYLSSVHDPIVGVGVQGYVQLISSILC